MERSVQAWVITDPMGLPLQGNLPLGRIFKTLTSGSSPSTNLYCEHADGGRTLLEPLAADHYALHSSRTQNLPAEDAGGWIVPLSIPVDHGLAETTHFRFFRRNVVLCLYNHFGPRPQRLADWFNQRLELPLAIHPIYRHDMWSQIDQMMEITRVDLKVPSDQVAALEVGQVEDADVLSALRTLGRASRGGYVTFGLGVGRGRHAMSQGQMRLVLRALRVGGVTGAASRAKVFGKGPFGQAAVVDLVHDRLVMRTTVEPENERSRQPANQSAYEVLGRVHDAMLDDIELSVSPLENQTQLDWVVDVVGN